MSYSRAPFVWEGEFEGEAFANPQRRLGPQALMERLGREAAAAESEDEAEAFLGALVPLAAQAVPQAASSLARAAPQLISGVAHVGRVLRGNPATRGLVRVLPAVTRRTAADIARQASSQASPPTPQSVAHTLARQTARALGSRAGTVASPHVGYEGQYEGEYETRVTKVPARSPQSILDDMLSGFLRRLGIKNPVMYDSRGRRRARPAMSPPRAPAQSPLDARRYGPPRRFHIDAGPPKVQAVEPREAPGSGLIFFHPLGHGYTLPPQIRYVTWRDLGRGFQEPYPMPRPGYTVYQTNDGSGMWAVTAAPR